MDSSSPLTPSTGVEKPSPEREAKPRAHTDGFAPSFRSPEIVIRSDNAEPLKVLLRRAKKGDAAAQTAVGDCYYRARDFDNAVLWYRLAADQGNIEAQFSFGELYCWGQGVDRDLKEARRWLLPAAERGHAWAQVRLGGLYSRGQGGELDADEAVKWLQRAADQGNAAALSDLSMRCYEGEGVEQDAWKALSLASLAAEKAAPQDGRRRNWRRWLELELACSVPLADGVKPITTRPVTRFSEEEPEIQPTPFVQAKLKRIRIWDFLGQVSVPERYRHGLAKKIEQCIEQVRRRALSPHNSIEIEQEDKQYKDAGLNRLSPKMRMDVNDRVESTIKFLTQEGVPERYRRALAQEILHRIEQICGVSLTEEAMPEAAERPTIPKSWQEAKAQVPGLMTWEEAKEANPQQDIIAHMRNPATGYGRWTLEPPGLPRSHLFHIDKRAYGALGSWLGTEVLRPDGSKGTRALPDDLHLPTRSELARRGLTTERVKEATRAASLLRRMHAQERSRAKARSKA